MEKLKNKTKAIAVLKILFAVVGEILLLYLMKINGREDLGTFGIIFLITIWTIAFFIYFVSGIRTLKNYNKSLLNYLKESNITMQQLEMEIKSAKKIDSIYIGKRHIFSNDNLGMVVIPIASINKLKIVHLGYNPAKMRKGYYYLYIYVSNSEERRKIYSIVKNGLIEAADEITKTNKNIECINIYD